MRAAVRMLTINVYSVQDAAMLDFVASAPCNHYFHEVALHLSEHALHFDRHLEALHAGAPPHACRLMHPVSCALPQQGWCAVRSADHMLNICCESLKKR